MNHAHASAVHTQPALLIPARQALPGSGLPQERLARLAARRAFVDMKLRFSDAVACIMGARGVWLREQVRVAEEPEDLWLLRGAVFSALQDAAGRATAARMDLHRVLDSAFPDSGALLPEPTPA